MTQLHLELPPQLPFWLLRMAAQPALGPRFANNPVLFAAWYAPICRVVSWPDEVTELQEEERGKKMSLERISTVLSKVNYATDSRSRDVEYLRSILEGFAVHAWVENNQEQFQALVTAALVRFDSHYDTIVSHCSNNLTRRIDELAGHLGLTALERDLLVFGVASNVSEELRTILAQFEHSNRLGSDVFAAVFGTDEAALAIALAPNSPLRLSGLLSTRGAINRYPVVSDFWIRLLTEAPEGLATTLTEPFVFRPTSGVPAHLPEEDVGLAVGLLENAQEPGVNLLLYGAGGLDKQAVLQELVARTGKVAYRLARLEQGCHENAALAYIAQRCLASHDAEAVLVLDRPGEVLETQKSGYMAKMLGVELDLGLVAPFDELMLTTNPVPTIWLAAQITNLSRDTVSRFVFHAGLQKARREERRAQLERVVSGMALSLPTQEAILKLEDVSAVQLEAGMRAARLFGAETPAQYETALLQAVRRSLKALQRDTAPKAKECVTQYSLEFLNCGGRFGPQQILKALTLRPQGSICLYGLPGTGKTQFVEYLAQSLGKRLLVKRASDLMNKYVGETEKNIAAMFEEAQNESAILFLDEADTFLGDRSKAHASWEVSKVNELLQAMERFEGIFVASTNLFDGLDAAALRRFTFKLEFCCLTPEQRWEMFLNETGLRAAGTPVTLADQTRWWELLIFMPNLCAGDFATVQRQCVLLGETLTPDEWIEQLTLECKVKTKARA